jgi:hypothetical protein
MSETPEPLMPGASANGSSLSMRAELAAIIELLRTA